MNSIPKSATVPVLQVYGLHFGFGQRALFANWACQIFPGLTVVLGGESTGKSTLVQLLAGIISPQAGELTLGDANLGREQQRYRQSVAWCHPKDETAKDLTAVALFERMRQHYPDVNTAELNGLTTGFSLQEHLHKPIYMLSTGTRHKVFLTATLTSGAKLVLLDDPFAALDMASILFLKKCLSGWAQRTSKACVITLHEAPRDLEVTDTINLNALQGGDPCVPLP
jgi:ABC-type multidrug transport system ATPase subunit